MSKSTNNLIFRNFLTDDVVSTKATAFTPDIIPHFGNKVDPAVLISEYDLFMSLPLQPSEINNVFFRGQTTSSVTAGSKTAVVLRAVPSELILWPQVWNQVKPTGPGPLVIDTSTPNSVVALGTPFAFKPPNMGGFNTTLIATQSPVPAVVNSKTRFRDALQAPPADASNWQDMVDFINNDTSTVFYNVVVADPNAPVISVSTRLRVIDDGTSPLNFLITLATSTMPAGTSVSMSSPSGMINLDKVPLTDDIGVHVSLSGGFDDIITLNIFPAAEDTIETFAWVSLQASIVVPQTARRGLIPISEVFLLGSLNVVFHDDATTNLRFSSPSANQLKEHLKVKKAEAQAVVAKEGTVGTTDIITGAATGWWFRDDIGNINLFPRTTTLSHSPDIQPVGTVPRSDSQTILGGSNANIDWCDANAVAVSEGAPNYIYLRGNCTLGSNYVTEFRLFCVPNALLLYPSNYSQFSVTDFDDDGDPFVATRTITSTSANSFNVILTAFDLLNPLPPPSGSDHYCLIAESRNPTAANPDPDWPHEDTGAFASAAGFDTWIAGSPDVCWRNITYRAGGAQMICTAICEIPAGVYPSSAEWTLEVDAENAPVGSAWALTGSGPSIPGVSIGFAQTTITATNESQGCHFTGLPSSGYTFSIVLQWFSEGHAPGAGMNFSFLLFTTTPPAANVNASDFVKQPATLPDNAVNWPFTVGIYHPGVENKGEGKKSNEGYLGRRYKEIGSNQWPYARVDKDDNLKSIQPSIVYSVGGDHWNFRFS
ncbi:hypothetical protein JR316_0000120 [Psilocybe cubensis]|uniref:Uncharacterized protein n=2 Tax=Psilocybe cubensis TaxID=181762 RepID=A0A8H7Y4J5_PSICU|nr:hypothetical protein JR316_0000120 [Psilocybe cubensis]KAH9486056.1 hypothetical protein JR316_0000120 [Psilocybe cubensis]